MCGRMLLSLILMFAVGCATPYQKLSGKFGYDDFRITEDVFEVSFSGNAKTPASTVSRYVFRRAAEVTLQNGFTHFLPMQEADQSLYGEFYTSSGTTHYHGGQNSGSSWSQGSSSGLGIPFRMPAITMRVRCFKPPLPESDRLIDATDFLKYNFPESLEQMMPQPARDNDQQVSTTKDTNQDAKPTEAEADSGVEKPD